MADVEDPKERINELNIQLQNELNMWDVLGVEPNQVIQFNPTQQNIWLQTLTKFLAEKGIIDEDEFVIHFKEKMIDVLRNIRQEIETQQARARIHIPNKGMFN